MFYYRYYQTFGSSFCRVQLLPLLAPLSALAVCFGDPLAAATFAGPSSETYVAQDGAALFCRSIGQGPIIIVLHGGPGLGQDYLLPSMAEMAKCHRVVFYDQRGCGRSTGEVTPNTTNFATYIKDLEAVRCAFTSGPVTLIGHSWGAVVASQYASAYPQCVSRLILSNPLPSTAADITLSADEYTRCTAPVKADIDTIEASAPFSDSDPDVIERWFRLMFRSYCYKAEKCDLLNFRMSREAAASVKKVIACWNSTIFDKSYDLTPILRALNIPTLVIAGDSDTIPAVTARHYADNIHGARYVLMTHCGHFPFVEDPRSYFQILNSFCE